MLDPFPFKLLSDTQIEGLKRKAVEILNKSDSPEMARKFALYHLFLLAENVNRHIDLALDIERSNVNDNNAKNKHNAWIAFDRLIIIDAAALLDEWLIFSFMGIPEKLVLEVNDRFKELASKWPSTVNFRNRALAHSYRTRDKVFSIFSAQGCEYFDITDSPTSTTNFAYTVKYIFNPIRAAYPEYIGEFISEVFPPSLPARQ